MNVSEKAYLSLLLCGLLCFDTVRAQRIKDIGTIEGISGVQVIGYGLVTGLNNTGDSQLSTFTTQSIVSMLKRFGLTVPAINLRTRNCAAVMVTTSIPSFARKGTRIDVQVSSIGDARSIQGGILLFTPLSGEDGSVYATAQGAVSTGGYDAGSGGNRAAKNPTLSGRIPNGGNIDKAVEMQFHVNNTFKIVLSNPDFTTALKIADAVNARFKNTSTVLDGGAVLVKLPQLQQPLFMKAISEIETMPIQQDAVARIVINERTGTIVIGGNVRLQPCVIAQSGLEIQVQRVNSLSQPFPLSTGTTQSISNTTVNITEEKTPAIAISGAASVQDMATALNSLKVSARDLISIFQALKESGSLQGELVIQ